MIVEKYSDGTAALFAQEPNQMSIPIEDGLEPDVAQMSAEEMAVENGILKPNFISTWSPSTEKTILFGPWFNFAHP